jgi:uncharacterized membrane protein/glutaredoxin
MTNRGDVIRALYSLTMLRKRQPTWIQRNSRFVIAAIATLGIVNTGYLTAARLLKGSVVCPVEGCDKVLESAYATVFGSIPLSALGLLAYVAMLAMAIAPWLLKADAPKTQRSLINDQTWLGLSIGGTAMAVFSGYLMSIMVFEIQAFCPYCVGSAISALCLFGLAIVGHDWDDLGAVGFRSVIIASITLIGAFALYAPLNTNPNDQVSGYAITTVSKPANIELAEYLKASDIQMFGAFWCGHCRDQKQLFGQAASSKLDYVECDPNGQNPQPDRCQAEQIESYPTWTINGEQYLGVQSLQELAQLSGYTGSTDFGVEE